jgi:hypothetical protein
MGRMFRRIIVTLCCTILLAATAQAETPKQVYLKDGGIIVCQKIWQTNGKVMALVNRDTLVDLSKDEVDLRKTFGKKPVKTVKNKGKKKIVVKHETVRPQAAPQPPVKPPAAPANAKKIVVPTVKPAPPPAVPAIKKALQQPKTNTAMPAQPVVHPTAPKVQVLGPAALMNKPAPGTVAAARTSLPLAKPSPPPPPKPSFWAANTVNIVLVVLLILLAAGYMAYKKQQKK